MYKHEDLGRPKEQIRLLRVEGGHEDEDLVIALQTWDMCSAPEYYAVSYTWGENVNRTILVNGQACRVRSNCYHALWQVRLHHPGEYIWIDSICINQDDLEERSCQVSLMEKIYSRALWTLACIGPHENSSEMVIASLRQMKDTNRRAAEASGVSIVDINASADDPGGYFYRRRWHRWVDSLDEAFLIRFREALVAFARRAYWTRLWIVQEVALSQGRGQLFCGNDVLFWGDMELILQLVGGGENDQGFLDAPPTALWGEAGVASVTPDFQVLETLWRFDTNLYIDSVISATSSSLCSDQRDHIYGVLCLIQWKQGQAPIVPDYTRSPFHLAMEAIAHMRDIAVVPLLLDLLHIHHARPEMLDLLAESTVTRETTSATSTSWKDTVVEVKLGYSHMVRCAEIIEDQNGGLTVAAMHNDHSAQSNQRERERLEAAFRATLPNGKLSDDARQPQRLKYNGGDVIVVSGNAGAGDIILPISPLSCSTPCFIVLRSNDVSLDVVGQGFFLPGFDILKATEAVPLTEEAKRSILDAEMVLTMTVADIMRLYGQDFVDLKTYDPDARLQRLRTCAVERPEGAVAPLFIQEYSLEKD